jgi:hypothetical protein
MDVKELWLEGTAYIQLAQDKIKLCTVTATAINQP